MSDCKTYLSRKESHESFTTRGNKTGGSKSYYSDTSKFSNEGIFITWQKKTEESSIYKQNSNIVKQILYRLVYKETQVRRTSSKSEYSDI